MAIVHERGWAPRAFEESVWFFPLAALWRAHAHSARFPDPAELSAQYRAEIAELRDLGAGARALRFVATPPKKRRARRGPVDLSALYEGRIVKKGEVPTRLDDWHDFFNALSFSAFPRAKWALHARQFALLEARVAPGAARLPGARSREQDALALFDEGGIALCVLPERRALLDQSGAAFSETCEALCRAGDARAVPFGHALPEHLVAGLPAPLGTPHPLFFDFRGLANKALIGAVDEALAVDLAEPAMFRSPSPARGLSLLSLHAEPRASTPAIEPQQA